MTVVPELRPVRSKVLPDGTARADKMIVLQEVLDLLAEEAPPDPEKVQVVALLAISGAAVGSGCGRPSTSAEAESRRAMERLTMIVRVIRALKMWKLPRDLDVRRCPSGVLIDFHKGSPCLPL